MLKRFVSDTFTNFVGRSAEQFFQEKVAEFCVNFHPEHVKRAGESGKPFEELVAGAGFQLQPTSVEQLNPWAAPGKSAGPAAARASGRGGVAGPRGNAPPVSPGGPRTYPLHQEHGH